MIRQSEALKNLFQKNRHVGILAALARCDLVRP